MTIFKDTAQRLKFCFSLSNMNPTWAGTFSQVKTALSDAQADAKAVTQIDQAASLAADARFVLDEVLSLQQHESAALIAKFSHHWESRRIACDQLRDHYRPVLSRIIDDRHLLGKLVTRHYIAERERGSGWTLVSISHEFNVELERVKRGADLIDQHAKALERAALQSLEARLEKLEIEVPV